MRKLVLSEHQKDRAEDRASRCDDKIKGLEEELNYIGKSMKTLSVNGDKSAEKEDDHERGQNCHRHHSHQPFEYESANQV